MMKWMMTQETWRRTHEEDTVECDKNDNKQVRNLQTESANFSYSAAEKYGEMQATGSSVREADGGSFTGNTFQIFEWQVGQVDPPRGVLRK